MPWLAQKIFPRLMDWSMGSAALDPQRRLTLAEVRGQVLEIGFGSGRNLPFYPPAVERLVAVDPNPGTWRLAEPRLAQATLPIERHQASATDLPFAAGMFDCVVSTFTLCSITPPEQALAEVRRVLRPGGRFYFLEHGLSPDPWVARVQHWATPLTRWLGEGCHLNRPIRKLLDAQPFAQLECSAYYLPALPRAGGYLYRGWAIRHGPG